MNWILLTLAIIVGWIVIAALVMLAATLPLMLREYKQRRLEEYYLAELRSAEVKAARHRDVP